ncbi:MAG: PAS domain S-box protein [Deltaproteobacteria bacterium]|nr:PAS domain S-box protein [Deltaproteobacteria bacterium]MBW2340671.1 PAS domain S-box protein [Deltaproteobacteria bacterium]
METFDWREKLFESLSFPTLILAPDMTIVAASKRFLDKHNYSKKQVTGRKCYEILYQSEAPCSQSSCPLRLALIDKKGTSSIKKTKRPSGEEVYEDRVCSPILDEKGEVGYLMLSLRDVTKTKLLEIEIQKTNEFLKNIIASSTAAILVADMKGVILLMNQSARELFGYSDKVAVGTSIAEYLYTPGGARSIMKKLRSPDYGGVGKLYTTEMTIINSSGEEIPVEMTASIIYQDGKEVATMGIYNDLRPKIEIEKKLKEAERIKLEQSNKMASLGQLAAGVAHEINNPLSGILIDASLILEELDEDSPIRDDMQNIVVDTHRCKDIVKNLLAYSRQAETKRELFNINDVIEQTFAFLEHHALFQNITIKKEFSSSMLTCEGDKNQLVQVFTNIIINAAHAINGKGNITIRSSRDKPKGKIYIEFSDTGCGISKEALPKIFDHFFTTKEEGKGTGLGLGTVKSIIEKHGGKIKVKETSPEGTTFLIELPLFKVTETTPI